MNEETKQYKLEYEARKRAEQFERNPNISPKKQAFMDKLKGLKESYDKYQEKRAEKRVEFLKRDNERLSLENKRAKIMQHAPQRTYNSGFEGSLFGNKPFGNQQVKNTFGADFFSTAPQKPKEQPKKHKHKHHRKQRVKIIYKYR